MRGSALNSPCGPGLDPTVIIFDDGTAPPVRGNVVTIPNPARERRWVGVGRRGIRVTVPNPDPDMGHSPEIELYAHPASPVPITFDAVGRVSIGPAPTPTLNLNGGAAVAGGIRFAPAGEAGHSAVVTIEPDPTSPIPIAFSGQGKLRIGPVVASSESSMRIYHGLDGRLAVDPPNPWKFESVNAGGNTRTILLRNTLTNATVTLGTA